MKCEGKVIVQYDEQHYTDFGLNHWDVFDRQTGESVGYITKKDGDFIILIRSPRNWPECRFYHQERV